MTPAVSIAGEIAEELMDPMDGETWNGEVFADYHHDMGFQELSPTDRAFLPEDENEFREAVQEAYDLLRENWDFFLWCVRELMREGVVTNGMADEYQRRIDERPKPTPESLNRSRKSCGIRSRA